VLWASSGLRDESGPRADHPPLPALAQGLALGGEYGGAATYVARHAPDERRGRRRAGSRPRPRSDVRALLVIGIGPLFAVGAATFSNGAGASPSGFHPAADIFIYSAS